MTGSDDVNGQPNEPNNNNGCICFHSPHVGPSTQCFSPPERESNVRLACGTSINHVFLWDEDTFTWNTANGQSAVICWILKIRGFFAENVLRHLLTVDVLSR
jgi:hypothetical protein